MKKRINLLTKQLKYRKIEDILINLRIILVILTAIFLVLFITFSLILFGQKREIDKLLLNKQNLLSYLLANKEVEAKFVFFNNRYQEIKNIMKNDVNFLPYYSLLNDSLKLASPSPHLKSLVINKDKTVNFTLDFIDLPSLLTFLKFGESDEFLKNYNQLVLGSFNVIQQGGGAKNINYQLIFNGKFRSLP